MAQLATKKDIPVLFANGEQSIMKRNKNVLAKFSPFKKNTTSVTKQKIFKFDMVYCTDYK